MTSQKTTTSKYSSGHGKSAVSTFSDRYSIHSSTSMTPPGRGSRYEHLLTGHVGADRTEAVRERQLEVGELTEQHGREVRVGPDLRAPCRRTPVRATT